MFDKDKYWENRKAGKRGQGGINPHNFGGIVVGLNSSVHHEPNSRKERRLYEAHGPIRRQIAAAAK